MLALVGLGLTIWGSQQAHSGIPALAGYPDQHSVNLLYFGNFNLGLGTGLGAFGLILLFVSLGVVISNRLARRD